MPTWTVEHETEEGSTMAEEREKAAAPDDLTRLFVERANAGDADGLAALYEPDAVLAYPPGQTTRGRDEIRGVYERMVAMDLTFEPEDALPTVENGEIALTGTHRRDGSGTRIQVARRQADGTWLRVLDHPEPPAPAG